jgi:hypothetical protein
MNFSPDSCFEIYYLALSASRGEIFFKNFYDDHSAVVFAAGNASATKAIIGKTSMEKIGGIPAVVSRREPDFFTLLTWMAPATGSRETWRPSARF